MPFLLLPSAGTRMDRPVTNLILSNGWISYRNNCIFTITINGHSCSVMGSLMLLKSVGSHPPTILLGGKIPSQWDLTCWDHPSCVLGCLLLARPPQIDTLAFLWVPGSATVLEFPGLAAGLCFERGGPCLSSSIPWCDHMSLCRCVKSPKALL